MKKKKEKDYYVSIITQRMFDPVIGVITYRDVAIVYSIYRNSNKLITLLDFSTGSNYYRF